MPGRIDTVLEIDTPEHLAFRTRIAGPGRRTLAWLLDLLVRLVLLFVLAQVLMSFTVVDLGELGTGLVLIALFVLDWFYFSLAEILTKGKSVGKLALRLRVVRENGLPIGWRESILRNFFRFADLLIISHVPPQGALLGPLVMCGDARFRRIGDMVGGTVVVVEESTQVSDTMAVQADPALVEELPALLHLDRDDLEALELFVNRSHVSDARRQELAEIVAPIYADRLSLARPRDATRFLASLWVRAQDPRRRTGR